MGHLESIVSITEINKICIDEYLRGVYVYGMDKYGHPVLYDEGLKYRKKSEAMKLFKACGEKGMDMILAHLIGRLREIKRAVNGYYGYECCADEDKRMMCITRHVLVFDLTKFSSFRVLKDMKIHEY